MDASRALKLSQGALYGVQRLTIEQIRDRVAGRYPEAAVLPGRPELDELLNDSGLEFTWETAPRGAGHYVNCYRDAVSITSGGGSGTMSRLSTVSPSGAPVDITPEVADARQFEERLKRAVREGAFLALQVHPKAYQQAADELARRFDVRVFDLEAAFIEALRTVADQAKVNWDLVVETDARPGEGNWDRLMLLVGRALPQVEQQLSSGDQTLLITYPGLLARYDQMTLLERLRDRVGRRDGIPGAWLLIPGEETPMMDGRPIPLLSSGQRTRVPLSWLRNLHRGTVTRAASAEGTLHAD